jgi:hypothetical protein
LPTKGVSSVSSWYSILSQGSPTRRLVAKVGEQAMEFTLVLSKARQYNDVGVRFGY